MNVSQLPTMSTPEALLQSLPTPQAETASAVRDVESLFISMLIKEMRASGSEGGLFPGDNSDSLGGMFDMFLGQHIAESGGIGLAESLMKSMS